MAKCSLMQVDCLNYTGLVVYFVYSAWFLISLCCYSYCFLHHHTSVFNLNIHKIIKYQIKTPFPLTLLWIFTRPVLSSQPALCNHSAIPCGWWMLDTLTVHIYSLHHSKFFFFFWFRVNLLFMISDLHFSCTSLGSGDIKGQLGGGGEEVQGSAGRFRGNLKCRNQPFKQPPTSTITLKEIQWRNFPNQISTMTWFLLGAK